MWITIANLALWAVSTHDKGRVVAWSVLGACAGVYLFFRGFKMLQFKRLIENTPTSKIRSASMGLVELSGIAAGPNTIPAGITGERCFYYRAMAWEYQRSGNRSEWKRVADESLFIPFFIQDDTGGMLVNAQGADMDVQCNFKDEFGESFFSSNDVPMGAAQDFLLRYGIAGRQVRVEEHCIKPDCPLFVLGTLGENKASWGSTPEKHWSASTSSIHLGLNSRSGSNSLLWRLGGLPGAQMEMRASGSFSMRPVAVAGPQMPPSSTGPATSSWKSISMDDAHPPMADAAAAEATPVVATASAPRISQEAAPIPVPVSEGRSGSLSDMPPLDWACMDGFDVNARVAIGKGDAGTPFTISSESQRELVSSLGWKSVACIWGGPALTVTCVYILLWTLGWM